jgi:hypothetical protein
VIAVILKPVGSWESIIASREEMDRWRTEMFGETAAASSVA